DTDGSGAPLRVDLKEGTTVEIDPSHTGGGLARRIYRYVGADRTNVAISAENYTSSNWVLLDKLKLTTLVAGQRWALMAPDGQSYVLARTSADGAPLELGVSRHTINAVSAAVSLAVGIGGT